MSEEELKERLSGEEVKKVSSDLSRFVAQLSTDLVPLHERLRSRGLDEEGRGGARPDAVQLARHKKTLEDLKVDEKDPRYDLLSDSRAPSLQRVLDDWKLLKPPPPQTALAPLQQIISLVQKEGVGEKDTSQVVKPLWDSLRLALEKLTPLDDVLNQTKLEISVDAPSPSTTTTTNNNNNNNNNENHSNSRASKSSKKTKPPPPPTTTDGEILNLDKEKEHYAEILEEYPRRVKALREERQFLKSAEMQREYFSVAQHSLSKILAGLKGVWSSIDGNREKEFSTLRAVQSSRQSSLCTVDDVLSANEDLSLSLSEEHSSLEEKSRSFDADALEEVETRKIALNLFHKEALLKQQTLSHKLACLVKAVHSLSGEMEEYEKKLSDIEQTHRSLQNKVYVDNSVRDSLALLAQRSSAKRAQVSHQHETLESTKVVVDQISSYAEEQLASRKDSLSKTEGQVLADFHHYSSKLFLELTTHLSQQSSLVANLEAVLEGLEIQEQTLSNTTDFNLLRMLETLTQLRAKKQDELQESIEARRQLGGKLNSLLDDMFFFEDRFQKLEPVQNDSSSSPPQKEKEKEKEETYAEKVARARKLVGEDNSFPKVDLPLQQKELALTAHNARFVNGSVFGEPGFTFL